MIKDLFCPKCGDENMYKSGRTTNVGAEKQNYMCNTCKKRTTRPRKPEVEVPMRASVPQVKRYIVTAAQNSTPIHARLWESIKNCAEYYDAEIIVIPGRYKNPTSQWTKENDDNEWWAAEVMPYLVRGTINLGKRLIIINTKIQWASMNPLTSMETLSGDKSVIVGHSKLALKSVATPQNKQPKLLYTTGCVTVKNYSDTKQGDIAKFNHSSSALIVEVSDDHFHVRQLCAMQNGSFCDLGKEFKPDEVKDAPRPLAITMGDTHWDKIDPQVYQATFKDMIPNLQPHHLIWHDLLDQYSRNHHHLNNYLVQFRKHKLGQEDVKKEVDRAIQALADHTPDNCQSVIVSSNHDRALHRWLLEAKNKEDPVNLEFYTELTSMVLKYYRENNYEDIDPFILYGREKLGGYENIKFLEPDESFMLNGIEKTFHGDKGPNGSRGSVRSLSRISVRTTIGHGHSANIIDGCWQVGTSTGKLEYSGGPSSWSNTHELQYYNGKRTLITIINGEWKL